MDQSEKQFAVRDYDLAATLASGQAFRWEPRGDAWVGVVGRQWVQLEPGRNFIFARTAGSVSDWNWLAHYLQLDLELEAVLASFPADDVMRSAVSACAGLRLLRQDPWECLASFILSSTKQIVQIRQILALLCKRHGDRVPVPAGYTPAFAFPSPEQLAGTTEAALRNCKMGFRAPNLLATARVIAEGRLDLSRLGEIHLNDARAELLGLPGVGPKIADCVLLFAYGFQAAFPVDVWVMKALRQLYFPRRRPKPPRLKRFTETYFGVHAGYAQQYLFHYMRTRQPRPSQRNGHLQKKSKSGAQILNL